MITKRTVLVLGAGASVDSGFPTGAALLCKIDKMLAKPEKLNETFLRCCRTASVDGFKMLRQRLQGAVSIDSFLQHNGQYEAVGKWLIAMALGECEKEEALYTGNNWYKHLFNAMRGQLADFGNRISFVTFNYDRSLEFAMLRFLMDHYNDPAESMCIRQIRSIPIYHVHGHLGYLPGFSDDGINETPYGRVDFKATAQTIKIIHDSGVDRSMELRRAKELIEDAEVICFLGFGYHPTNLTRLTGKILKDSRIIRGEETPIKVFGTAYDLDASIREFVEGHISGIKLEPCKIDQMFKRHNFLSVRHDW